MSAATLPGASDLGAPGEGAAGLLEMARAVTTLARSLGADEVRTRIGRSVSTELTRRDGKLEKAEESRSMGLRVSLLVDDRFSAHSTSDLRPDALRPFLERAIEATRFLEPDVHRRLPERERMGSADLGALDAWDDTWPARDPAERRARLARIEELVRAEGQDVRIRSASSFVWDGASERVIATSHGFESAWRTTSFGHGAMVSLEDEGGRLPEAYDSCGTRHREDLRGVEDIAASTIERARHRLGSAPAKSGRYPMLLENRVTGRILGTLLAPMSGEAIYEKRSCMEGKLGQAIAAAGFSLLDDPLIPRAPGSRPHDGDGLPSSRRALVRDGVLQQYLVDVYDGRRLGVEPTGGGTGNLLVPAGERSPAAILADLPRAIRVEGFLGGNANPASGDFSFGISGQLLERGRPVANVSEMNVSGNLFELFARFALAADDVWTWSAWRTPSLLFDDVQFSGS